MIADSLLAYRNSDSTSAPLRAATLKAPVLLDPPLIDDRLGKLVERSDFRASQLDLATNVATTLVDLHEVDEYNPSALGGDLAFFLDGADVVAYDLKSHSIATVLTGLLGDVIVPQRVRDGIGGISDRPTRPTGTANCWSIAIACSLFQAAAIAASAAAASSAWLPSPPMPWWGRGCSRPRKTC